MVAIYNVWGQKRSYQKFRDLSCKISKTHHWRDRLFSGLVDDDPGGYHGGLRARRRGWAPVRANDDNWARDWSCHNWEKLQIRGGGAAAESFLVEQSRGDRNDQPWSPISRCRAASWRGQEKRTCGGEDGSCDGFNRPWRPQVIFAASSGLRQGFDETI